MIQSVYLYALLANICFSSSSLVFTEFANKTNVIWVNQFKVFVSAFFCALTITVLMKWNFLTNYSLLLLVFSGFIGLNIGDFFMLKAFQSIGPGRTLMLYGFEPLIVGTASYYLFGQTLNPQKLLAIFFLVGCLFTFSYEKFKEKGSWELKGFLMALVFVCLDSAGLVLTRVAFDNSPELSPIEAHFYRCFGALLGFWALGLFRPLHFIRTFRNLSLKSRWAISVGSFFGTFLSLALYFKAIQVGNMATVTSISITAPFLATLFECIYHKKKPSKYLILAFAQFLAGFFILMKF